MKGMKVVMLCGGKGTRLREHAKSIPKPLVEIGGRPILWHVMKVYSYHGFKDFILCLGYKAEDIIKFFVNYAAPTKTKTKKSYKKLLNNETLHVEDWNITFVDTGPDTNTGGRIKRAQPYIDGKDFFATYADAVSDIDIVRLLNFHKRNERIATITCVNPVSPFGILKSDRKNIITDFKEKPKLNQWINAGFFVFKKGIFEYLRKEDVLEKDTFNRLIAQREMLAYKYRGFWACMDTYKDTVTLDTLIRKGKCPWMKWGY